MPIYERNIAGMNTLAGQSADRLGKLRELILGHKNKLAEQENQSGLDTAKYEAGKKVDYGLETQGQQRNIEAAKAIQAANPAGTHVTMGDKSVGINTPDPITILLKKQAIDERNDARDDKDLVHLGERIDKGGIPNAMSGLANLETGTNDSGKGGILTDPSYQVKSAGPVANMLPQFAKNIGEKVGLMPKGSADEAALIQRLVNADIKALSGSAVSTHEMGRQNVEKGMSAGGDPNLIKIGIKQMKDAIESGAQNVASSTRPEVLDKFKQQGGKLSLEEFLGKGSSRQPQSGALSAEEQAELAALKAKHGRR